MRNTGGLLRGGPGRPAGVPNRSSRKMKAFLDEVFDDVFARAEFKQRLVDSIVNLNDRPKGSRCCSATTWAARRKPSTTCMGAP